MHGNDASSLDLSAMHPCMAFLIRLMVATLSLCYPAYTILGIVFLVMDQNVCSDSQMWYFCLISLVWVYTYLIIICICIPCCLYCENINYHGSSSSSDLVSSVGGVFAVLPFALTFIGMFAWATYLLASSGAICLHLKGTALYTWFLVTYCIYCFVLFLFVSLLPLVISLLAAGISTNNLEDSRNEEWLKAGASHDIDEVAPLNSLRKEEPEAIIRIVDIGYSENEATEAFLTCDRNETVAVNRLLDKKSLSVNLKNSKV